MKNKTFPSNKCKEYGYFGKTWLLAVISKWGAVASEVSREKLSACVLGVFEVILRGGASYWGRCEPTDAVQGGKHHYGICAFTSLFLLCE
jgi:hypothetical protein